MNKMKDASSWDELYKKQDIKKLPWFNPKLDFDLQEFILKYNAEKSSILNLGESPGTQAVELSKLGFEVTAIDISRNAIEKARKLAKKNKVIVDFRIDNVINIKIKKKFDYIFDRGCFHVLNPNERERYIKNVYSLLNKKGYLLLKCFSYKEKDYGPSRFRPSEIEFYFSRKFRILDIIETSFNVDKKKKHPITLFIIMRK